MMQLSTFLNIFKTLRDILEVVSKDFAILEHFFMQIIWIETGVIRYCKVLRSLTW